MMMIIMNVFSPDNEIHSFIHSIHKNKNHKNEGEILIKKNLFDEIQ